MTNIIVSAQKVRPILQGHPWIFPRAIAKQEGAPRTGELVKVFDAEKKLLGYGVFNEFSLYRVRMLTLCQGKTPFDLEAIILYRLQQAATVRQHLGLPNEHTSAYRAFNSEGDGLSGLTVDFFNDIAVVSSSAYWVELHRTLIEKCLRQTFNIKNIQWLSQTKSLKQDGWEVSTPLDETSLQTTIKENDTSFLIHFEKAQKTGLYLDQRENHARIAQLAAGKRVLDLYCYTGGFALQAAKHGALHVTAVDSSQAAILLAKDNAALNQLTNVEFIQGDARDFLATAGDYDLVILDPPKLVPSQRHLDKASQYYRYLHTELFKVLKSGTLLMTCNCSSAMSAQDFSRLINECARSLQRECRILGTYGAASCHPLLTAFPEGHYLHAFLLFVQ